MTTHSQPPSAGSLPETFGQEHLCVVCPICRKELRLLTGTHLRSHDMAMKEFRSRFPHVALESTASTSLRTMKAAEKQRERLQNDPEFAEAKRIQGSQLAKYRASLSPVQNAAIQRKSVATFLRTTTAEARSGQASEARAIAVARNPDMSSRGGKASAHWHRTPTARQAAAERFKRLWKMLPYRKHIRKTTSNATIDGRIPVIFRRARPTTRERKMIALLREWGIPLRYVGDGSFRVPTPGGQRHWRNPDFINEATRKILLLDLFRTAHADVETEDYLKAGWHVLRVKTDEMRSVEILERKVRIFVDGA